MAVLLREPSPLSLPLCRIVTQREPLPFVIQYVLTPEGIDYLREYLHLPAEVRLPFPFLSPSSPLLSLNPTNPLHLVAICKLQIVPATFKKQVRAPRPGQSARPEGGAYRAPRAGGDEGYRRRQGAEGGKEQGGDDFRPRFAGVGRGGPRTEA